MKWDLNNHHVVLEAVVHSKALSVETTVLSQVCQENMKRPRRLLVRPVQPSQLAGQSTYLLKHTNTFKHS